MGEPYKCFAWPCMQLSLLYGELKNALLLFHVPVSQTLSGAKWDRQLSNAFGTLVGGSENITKLLLYFQHVIRRRLDRHPIRHFRIP